MATINSLALSNGGTLRIATDAIAAIVGQTSASCAVYPREQEAVQTVALSTTDAVAALTVAPTFASFTSIAGASGPAGLPVRINPDCVDELLANGTTNTDIVLIGGSVVSVSGTPAAAATLLEAAGSSIADRFAIGPFSEALAATQTNNPVNYGGAAVGWVAPRAGWVSGLSSALSAALTGAGTTATAYVRKNGTALVAGPQNAYTQAGGAVKANAVVGQDAAFAFVAGDVIDVAYDSTAISNTPTLVATVEITYQ